MSPRLPPLVLAYHGVAELPVRDDPHGLFVWPRDLRRHIRVLRGWGYELHRFGELAARVRRGAAEGVAALTFDDGLADNLDNMLPLVEAESAPATVFVVSEWLGRRHPDYPDAAILDQNGVRALHAAGIEIGSHTRTHPDLTSLTYESSLEELAGSKADLEALIEAPVTVAAYPSGLADTDARRACAAAGYAAACRNSGRGNWADPLDLPRQDMQNGDTILGLWLKRHDRYEAIMRSVPGRAARRLVRHSRRLTRPAGKLGRRMAHCGERGNG